MLKILLIEDNTSIREEMVFLLCLEGFDVLEAENGQKGLKLAEKEHPDLIISDFDMPVLNGLEVLTGLRKNFRTEKTPVLFVTGTSLLKGLDKRIKEYKRTMVLT